MHPEPPSLNNAADDMYYVHIPVYMTTVIPQFYILAEENERASPK